jgi:hypothetical protein
MPEEPSVSDYVRSLTDRTRLYGQLREQRLQQALAEFRRAIENGEDPDGL